VRNLEQAGFVAPGSGVESGRAAFLVISLGLQMLYEGSEDRQAHAPRQLFRRGAAVRRRAGPEGAADRLNACARPARLPVVDNRGPDLFLFVHSYYVEAQDARRGVTDYGVTYAAAVWRDNISGGPISSGEKPRAGLRKWPILEIVAGRRDARDEQNQKIPAVDLKGGNACAAAGRRRRRQCIRMIRRRGAALGGGKPAAIA
jgi:hypothetical protein